MPKERFEDAFNKLEKVVSKLEEGNMPLEESLKLFEEGIRLSRFCNQRLEEAEKRVEILLRDKEGVLKAESLDASAHLRESSLSRAKGTVLRAKEETCEDDAEEEVEEDDD